MPEPPPAATDATEAAPASVVLLVDDEVFVRTVVARMLRIAGHTVITANDGPTAVATYARRADEIDCMVLDVAMPRMDGRETLRELRRIRRDVRVLLSSGYDEEEVMKRDSGPPPAGFIRKPFDAKTLLAALGRILRD